MSAGSGKEFVQVGTRFIHPDHIQVVRLIEGTWDDPKRVRLHLPFGGTEEINTPEDCKAALDAVGIGGKKGKKDA